MRRRAPRRTLANSIVTPWSWPCVLVFVEGWKTLEEFGGDSGPVIPRRLYLTDGRIVPTCVVSVEPQGGAGVPLGGLNFPTGLLAGGFPILSRVQNEDHLGTVACLVTDGDSVFALTNRHVAGPAGRVIEARVHGGRARVGVSDGAQVGKKPFSEVYRTLPASSAVANLDAGLVRVDDRSQWTAQVYGLGELGPHEDVSSESVSLALVGRRVVGFGSASGRMTGEIHALFYRFKTLAGLDYVTDLLIGPCDEGEKLRTHHGDSGALWCVEAPGRDGRPTLKPIAMQWGGHQLAANAADSRYEFALGTFLSVICRELDVEIVRTWNTGFSDYWGKLGHFLVGAKACSRVTDKKLRKLLGNNVENIGYGDDELGRKNGVGRKTFRDKFVPLADVPDLAWKRHKGRGKEGPTHFADMDKEGAGPFAGKTLLELSKKRENVSAAVWNRFYAALGGDDARKRGCLPFRVWQVFDEMCGYAAQNDVARFVAAAGVLAHYVGDACQPLHVSQYHHGRDESEANVHDDYETKMLDRHAPDLLAGVNEAVAKTRLTPIATGHDAAVAIVELMRSTFRLLPPEHVCDVFAEVTGPDHLDHMWSKLGDDTCRAIAHGCALLASLWQAAWSRCDKASLTDDDLGTLDPARLRRIYERPDFCASLSLRDLEEQGIGIPGSGAGVAAAPADASPARHAIAARVGKRRRTRARKTSRTPPG